MLAVPLSIKGRVAGTIYVDHRLRKGAFDQDDVAPGARLRRAGRDRDRERAPARRSCAAASVRSKRSIARLEVELAARREELVGIKQELRENREALAVRYDYRNIIGRTPRMLDLFRLLDRVTDTTLPVVIQGESGTGKELVARAIHINGPRRDRPFVGENCAAIPETLLESTLFGHVRGAFTGAEQRHAAACSRSPTAARCSSTRSARCRRACRASCCACCRRASSAASATSGRARSTCASSPRPTAISRRWSRSGSFREDLYYRLNVAQIALPPLRERRDDIPLLVEHFLRQAGARRPDARAEAARRRGAGAPRRATAGRATCASWRTRSRAPPRCRAIASRVADLSPQVAAGRSEARSVPDDPDSLLLKPRVERLERSLLREALGRAANNQTKAAELLGLSRFGLQKKLKRYNFSV